MNNEPVAWIDEINTFVLNKDYKQFSKNLQNGMIPLYTHPADLTDEEIESIWAEMSEQCDEEFIDMKQFARAVLKKASEK